MDVRSPKLLLNEKPSDFEAFLQKLEQRGYEIKRGKHTSVKGTRQKRFVRFRTLGAGHSEDEIKAVIAGEAEHRPHQKQPPKEQPFHLLVDIQAKLSEGKSEGYAPLDLFVEIAVHFDVTLDYLILGQVETKTELALSKKINDQKQAMKSLREHLLAFAMEIEVE